MKRKESFWRIHIRIFFVLLLIGTISTLSPQPAAAEGYLYWTSPNIGRVNLDGTNPNPNLISGISMAGALAVDGKYVYWIDMGPGRIGRANLDGSDVNYNFITECNNPRAITVDEKYVYWAGIGSLGSIGRANLDGSNPNPNWLAESCGGDIAVDANYIYWATFNNTIGRANLDGSNPNPNWLTYKGVGSGIVIDSHYVYWTEPLNNTICRANINGSNIDRNWITGCDYPLAIAVDAKYVYWVNRGMSVGNRTISRSNIDGSNVNQDFITGCGNLFAIAVTKSIPSLPYYNVPYLSQLNYQNWGQSACGPTSITMLLQYWYPNSKIDVPEVYHAATQANGYFLQKTTLLGAPLVGYYNTGFQDGSKNAPVWRGTAPDTCLNRVPVEFQGFHIGTYSGMVPQNAINYLKEIWGGIAQLKTGLTITNVIEEIKHRPVILNVNEGYGKHYIVLRGYDEKTQTFYINDPYPPYHDPDRTAPFPDANNVAVPYTKLSRWFLGNMITFQPPSNHTPQVRQYTVMVDNGIANFGDTGNLNLNCNGSNHCFEVDNINARTESTDYVWKSYHSSGKDWIYPVEEGHWVKWTPKLPIYGKYQLIVKFYGSSNQGNVQYDVHASTGRLLASKTINQSNTGYRAVSLGYFRLRNRAYVIVENMPRNCNADAIMFRYIGN